MILPFTAYTSSTASSTHVYVPVHMCAHGRRVRPGAGLLAYRESVPTALLHNIRLFSQMARPISAPPVGCEGSRDAHLWRHVALLLPGALRNCSYQCQTNIYWAPSGWLQEDPPSYDFFFPGISDSPRKASMSYRSLTDVSLAYVFCLIPVLSLQVTFCHFSRPYWKALFQ